jgi:hypothetical protein
LKKPKLTLILQRKIDQVGWSTSELVPLETKLASMYAGEIQEF